MRFRAGTGLCALLAALPHGIWAQEAVLPIVQPLTLAPAVAPGPAGLGDFTFRRVTPPVPGAKGPRIQVQIDPAEQARRLAAMAPPRPRAEDPRHHGGGESLAALPPLPPGAARAPGSYAWFWEKVPAAMGAGPGRYPLALAALSAGPQGQGVAAPRLQAMEDLAAAYGPEILAATVGTDVSPALVLAVMGVESGGKAGAISPAGAQGLMQLIPATATRFGVSDPFDPRQNIKGGVAYLHWLMGMFGRDPVLVLAAYNAGEGAVTAHGGVPPFAETRDYVPKVLAAWQVAQGLCQTRPELVSDPCVFRVLAAGL